MSDIEKNFTEREKKRSQKMKSDDIYNDRLKNKTKAELLANANGDV